mmetsp:Transcript_23779/g.80324  ORF Transcript_23779/g.80324 Transcript_23779/m.80324 type:complete len:233 (+) Transcript_23779:129-827(+)
MRGCPAPPTHRHARCTRRHRGATCGAQHRSRLFGAGAGGPAARPAAAAACGLLQLLRLWPAGPLRRRRLAHSVDGDRRGRGSLRGGLVGRGLVGGGRVPDRRRGGPRRPAAVRAGALLAQAASPAAGRRARGRGRGRGGGGGEGGRGRGGEGGGGGEGGSEGEERRRTRRRRRATWARRCSPVRRNRPELRLWFGRGERYGAEGRPCAHRAGARRLRTPATRGAARVHHGRL